MAWMWILDPTLVPQPLLFIPMADIINRLELSNTLTLIYSFFVDDYVAGLTAGSVKT